MHHDIYFNIASVLLCVCMIVSSAEAIAYRSLYIAPGLMNWRTSRMRSVALFRSTLLNELVGEKRIIHFAVYRIVAALFLMAVIAAGSSLLLPLAYIMVFISCCLFGLRTPYGLDGSDQATSLTVTVYLIYALTPSIIIKEAVHWFIAAELTLVYFTSGWNKLKAQDWRNGNYMWKLFSTGFYGMQKLGNVLEKHRWFAAFSSMAMVLAETLFFLYWIVPAPYSWIILACLGVFHLLTAITMGLNTFFWAFLAMYPSTIYCRLLLSW